VGEGYNISFKKNLTLHYRLLYIVAGEHGKGDHRHFNIAMAQRGKGAAFMHHWLAAIKRPAYCAGLEAAGWQAIKNPCLTGAF